MAEKFKLLHKKSWFFGNRTAEWNVLIIGYIILVILPVVKIQNGGCIQDGIENVYIIHTIFSKIIFYYFFYFSAQNL
jgi:uncharacterized integral membrane protein